MLRPDYPKEGVDKFEFFKQKFGGAENANRFFANIVNAAKDEDLQYAPLNGLKTGNTSDGHRLLVWARKFGKEDELLTEMYKAYNCDGQWVGDHEVLINSAERAGLDPAGARDFLAVESNGAAELQESLQRSHKLGVAGVPAFFINGQSAFSGAQPTEAFLEVFKQVT